MRTGSSQTFISHLTHLLNTKVNVEIDKIYEISSFSSLLESSCLENLANFRPQPGSEETKKSFQILEI